MLKLVDECTHLTRNYSNVYLGIREYEDAKEEGTSGRHNRFHSIPLPAVPDY